MGREVDSLKLIIDVLRITARCVSIEFTNGWINSGETHATG
jgi:hypothetical protein